MIPDTIHVGYVHPGTVHEDFMRSLLQAAKLSEMFIGMSGSTCARQYVARNDNIIEFLKGPAEWYLQIDTDMTFEITAPDDLVDAAVNADAKMAAGLCFIYNKDKNQVLPNIFMWNDEKKEYDLQEDYPEGERFYVDATGAAFLLVHRDLLEATDYPWHQDHVAHPDTGKAMGHDISFCHKIRTVTGEPILYCADIPIGHIKEFVVTEDTYKAYRKATQ